ncbi:hypothetical protein CS0771_52590 [Catellatospora sp. IY07-71]|uniref:DUF2306 domain-containing protein n=1 Tax=Catellatospora sp. IY07-71 TaxID=2728827 RepID=UPI001BB39781|nr:DUF2306 domain-containing protein [Catellatospora sp. IY07-71]BCJ75715.1 hypothetical protein CS0771_52590 [Catellatospora sp. IY07-71]
MSTTSLPAERPRSRGRAAGFWWLALTAVAIAAFAPLPYLSTSLRGLAAQDDAFAASYAALPDWAQAAFYVHIVCGGIALALSPLQLAARIRTRLPRLHRVNGRVVAISILAAGLGGLVLAPSNQAGPIGTAGFGLLAVLWIGFVGAAVQAARRRDFTAHRRWAVRTFALTYAAVMLRLWLGVLTPLLAGFGMDPEAAFELAYHLVPFLCWVPNLLLAEWLLRRTR